MRVRSVMNALSAGRYPRGVSPAHVGLVAQVADAYGLEFRASPVQTRPNTLTRATTTAPRRGPSLAPFATFLAALATLVFVFWWLSQFDIPWVLVWGISSAACVDVLLAGILADQKPRWTRR